MQASTFAIEKVRPNLLKVGGFERLPKWLNCFPLVAQWLWLGVRHLSVSLPSVANPYITCGGMVGEGKTEYFDIMGSLAKKYTAPYILVESDGKDFNEILSKMEESGLSFPVVAKPNISWCGYGVKLIQNEQQLKKYFTEFPAQQTIILQNYIRHAGEAGLFYARDPNNEAGKLIGITLRYYPKVIGDGIHSVRQLIEVDERLCRLQNSKLHEAIYNPELVPASGEEVRLSTIGSTRVGGLYMDGSEYITPQLNQQIDAIGRDMKEFYIGRFDVRYESLEQLAEGKGFTIIEVNGSGSEAIHAWDPKYSVIESYKIIFAKQRLLFKISAINRLKGYKPIGLTKLAKLHFMQQRLIKQYPLSN